MVAQHEECEKAAITFGFIHPFGSSMLFSRDVLGYVDQAFENRSNFAIVRASRDDAARERQVADHLLANGVKGLIVWPVSNDPNGEYFTALAQTTPVVLVDRLLPGYDLPAVIQDCYTSGQAICEHILGKLRKRRFLVLMDNLRITTYEETLRGMQHHATEMKRLKDITIIQLPITQCIQKINQSDFSQVPDLSEYIETLLKEGGYDALFCPQDDFIDYTLIEPGVMDRFPGLQLATTKSNGGGSRSQKYHRLGCLEWNYDTVEMVSIAADQVQRWLFTRQAPKGVVRLQMELRECPRKA